MTTWNKDNFNYSGKYLTYDMQDGNGRQFVARFKYTGMVTMGIFKKALMKSGISPKEYFTLLADPANSPIGILEDNGILTFDGENMTTLVDGKVVRKLR